MPHTDIRLALPSAGRLEPAAREFLADCGLPIYQPNPRQYRAELPALPGLSVLFQRPGDIVVGVREGSIDFGIAGLDAVEEKRADPDGDGLLILHDALGFGRCRLSLAVPEEWGAQTVADIAGRASGTGRPHGAGRPHGVAPTGAVGEEAGRPHGVASTGLRVATKFPNLTGRFLTGHGIGPFTLIRAEGTLEIAPAIGYADMISDLVSSGVTLRDNRLRELPDGVILESQAALIGNRRALQTRPEVLAVGRQLLEYFEAHLRAAGAYLVFANMRGDSAEAIAARMFAHTELGGLQGPTISPVIPRDPGGERWFAVNLVVRQDHLQAAIAQLRAIGGSGVVVSPVTYIFEEEPVRYRALLEALKA
ncbi:MAG: ATP phosphoribosyltransferase [Chloroflexi bacterium]|nr:ATP phosphoribosyltransferase [Chloroflexota bacterium]